MPNLSRLKAALRNLVRSQKADRDLDEEIRAAHQMLADEHVRDGLEPPAARRAAAIDLGGVEQVKERVREVRMGMRIEAIVRDVRYAVRGLVHNPMFSAVMIGTVALGIGANTALFSAVQSVLLRPLPYTDPDRLVMVWEDATFLGFPKNTPAPANYLDWRRLNQVFTGVAATRGLVATLNTDGPPEQVLGRAVTANFFPVLGVRPLSGRTFTEEEDTAGEPVVVISYRLWQGRYAGDPRMVGRRILLNGTRTGNATVIGIMSPDFVFRNREIDFWVPIHFTPADAATRGSHFMNVVARLRPDVSLQRAREDMSGIARQLATDYPDSNSQIGAAVVPVDDEFVADTRVQLLVLAGAAGCVLLIACANLANLLLSRAVARRSELAMRYALGATRGRLVQQMLIEGLLLAGIGGLLGVALAPLGATVISRLVPATLAAPGTGAINLPVLAFTAALSVLTGIAFSLMPAIYAARRTQHHTLQQTSRATTGGRNRLTREALVVLQVAIALVLLVGAGLMLRTLANLRAIDLGFSSDHLLTMRTSLPRERYGNPVRRLQYYDHVIDRARQLADVEAAAFVSTLPFIERGNTSSYQVDGAPYRRDQDALFRVATNDYLNALRVRVTEGRGLVETDLADAPKVLVINSTMARKHWPSQSPIGHQVRFGQLDGPWYSIVGVVDDVRERGYTWEMKPGVYVPYAQILDTWALPEYLIVRTKGDPLALTAAIRRLVSEADAQQPVTAVRTMDQILDLDVADRDQQATLLGAFSALALLLAALGLYGVLAHAVAQRQREIGLRMALGASRSSIVRSVVGRGLALTIAGLVAGLLLALLATQAITTFLYGVQANDPRTYLAVVGLLGAIAALASALPAIRAASVDPMQVLRQE